MQAQAGEKQHKAPQGVLSGRLFKVDLLGRKALGLEKSRSEPSQPVNLKFISKQRKRLNTSNMDHPTNLVGWMVKITSANIFKLIIYIYMFQTRPCPNHYIACGSLVVLLPPPHILRDFSLRKLLSPFICSIKWPEDRDRHACCSTC